MTHLDLMMGLARSRIDDLRQGAGRGSLEHKSRQRLRKLSVWFVNQENRALLGRYVQRERSAARQLGGRESVPPELVRSR